MSITCFVVFNENLFFPRRRGRFGLTLSGTISCLLYTSDAADEGLGVDLGGRRIIKKNLEQLA